MFLLPLSVKGKVFWLFVGVFHFGVSCFQKLVHGLVLPDAWAISTLSVHRLLQFFRSRSHCQLKAAGAVEDREPPDSKVANGKELSADVQINRPVSWRVVFSTSL